MAKVGRKRIPKSKKKVAVTFYVDPVKLKTVGGMDEARRLSKGAFEDRYDEINYHSYID